MNNNNDINFNEPKNSPNYERNTYQENNNNINALNQNVNNRINNPFNSFQFKKQPRPPQFNQKQKMNNLSNRYAVGYNK